MVYHHNGDVTSLPPPPEYTPKQRLLYRLVPFGVQLIQILGNGSADSISGFASVLQHFSGSVDSPSADPASVISGSADSNQRICIGFATHQRISGFTISGSCISDQRISGFKSADLHRSVDQRISGSVDQWIHICMLVIVIS